jgi:DNA-binding winged helix-turn-helix (wHTH) protein
MAPVFEFDGFRLEPQTNRLQYRGTPVKVTAKACSVLALLAERAPEVVSRAEFEAAVWPEGFVEPSNLTQTIYMLRKALGGVAPAAPIETVNGRGYRLIAPVARATVRPFPAAPRLALQRHWRMAASLTALASLVTLVVVVTLFGFSHRAALSDSQGVAGGARAGAAVHPQAAPRKN